MKKIVCDLCGKEVHLKEGYHLSIFDNKSFFESDVIEVSDSRAVQTYDVCENCKRRLAQFMRSQNEMGTV